MKWPDWWSWELELTDHLLERMVDRAFTEADLRLMMETADGCREDYEEGRWVVETTHDAGPGEVIVEPDPDDQVLVVVTAYPVD